MKYIDLFKNAELPLFDVLVDAYMSVKKSKSSNSFLLRGGTALGLVYKAKGREDLVRGTRDLDFDVKTIETWENLNIELENLLNSFSTLNLLYKVKYRKLKNLPAGDTTVLEVFQKNKLIYEFQIDMNIRPLGTQFEIHYKDQKVNICTIENMLADKLSVLINRKVCRRIKDLTDIVSISLMAEPSLEDVIEECLKLKCFRNIKVDDVFCFNVNNIPDMEHAYKKLVNNPLDGNMTFNEVYGQMTNFVLPIIRNIAFPSDVNNLRWNTEKRCWL